MFVAGDWSRLQFGGGYGIGIFSEQTQSRRHNHQQLKLVLKTQEMLAIKENMAEAECARCAERIGGKCPALACQ